MTGTNTNINTNVLRYINTCLLGLVSFFLFQVYSDIKDVKVGQGEIKQSMSANEVKLKYSEKELEKMEKRLTTVEAYFNNKK